MMYFSPSRNAFIGTLIWDDARPVDDQTYQAVMAQLTNGKALSHTAEGDPLVVNDPTYVPSPLKDLLALRVEYLNFQYEYAVYCIKSSYPLAETITWPVQIEDARVILAWLAEDPSRDISTFPRELAPFLYNLAMDRQARGLESDLLDLANRVIDNDSRFSPAMARLTAIRHVAEKELIAAHALNDREALEQVTWSFALTSS